MAKGSIPVLEQMLSFTTARHRAISNNVANVNTPFYKSIDAPEMEFKAALAEAFEGRESRHVPHFEFRGSDHIRPKAGGGLEVDAGAATGATVGVVGTSREAARVKACVMRPLYNLVVSKLPWQGAFKKLFPDATAAVSNKEISLCGWGEVLKSVLQDLQAAGVPKSKLNFEEWA